MKRRRPAANLNAKGKRKPRVKYENVFRVRWSSGDKEWLDLEPATVYRDRIQQLGINASLEWFKRPIMKTEEKP